MDALDVLMNKENIIPFFQPIISADTQLVVGYEVLARIETEAGTESLGWFFQDKTIPEEYRQEVDEQLRAIALEKYIMIKEKGLYLFFNIDVEGLIKDDAASLLSQLDSFKRQGLSYEQIVLEFNDKDYTGDFTALKHLLQYLQGIGIKIAIDDVGTEGSNLEKIALLKPNIVKVDLAFLGGGVFPQLYRDVLYSLSLLTRKIGATLLFEGVGDFSQLNYAWRNGGRYYQGFYLGRPKKDFVPLDFCKQTLKKEFHHFINYERKKIEAQLTLTEKLGLQLKNTLKKIKAFEHYDELVLAIAKECSNITFRVYICDNEGFQQSANAVKKDDFWLLEQEGRYKNWSWRPYFLENIVRMNYEQKGILSDLYTDIEREEIIRTYSFPIDQNLFLFIDIPYDFLYEQEGLL